MEEIDELNELALRAWRVRQENFAPRIAFAVPRRTRAVSVTGDCCSLNCAHCGGHYLQAMQPLSEWQRTGVLDADSCLISGGCLADGRVPVADHAPMLAALKNGRRYNLHVGLVDEQDAAIIGTLADVISLDFIGDDRTIREVLGLRRRVADYVRCYSRLKAAGAVVPHICIGLHGGELRGEYRALQLLRQLGVDALTFIVFMPTRGTRYANRQPPLLLETIRLLATARLQFPTAPIHLGCMRPGGLYRSELDQWAVRLGINIIVNPAPAARKIAAELGLEICAKEECCVL